MKTDNNVQNDNYRNTPVQRVRPFNYMRNIEVEYDATSVIPSIAVLSVKGIVDPRLKHNRGVNIDLNASYDPVQIETIARGVKRVATAIGEQIDASKDMHTSKQQESLPADDAPSE